MILETAPVTVSGPPSSWRIITNRLLCRLCRSNAQDRCHPSVAVRVPGRVPRFPRRRPAAAPPRRSGVVGGVRGRRAVGGGEDRLRGARSGRRPRRRPVRGGFGCCRAARGAPCLADRQPPRRRPPLACPARTAAPSAAARSPPPRCHGGQSAAAVCPRHRVRAAAPACGGDRVHGRLLVTRLVDHRHGPVRPRGGSRSSGTRGRARRRDTTPPVPTYRSRPWPPGSPRPVLLSGRGGRPHARSHPPR